MAPANPAEKNREPPFIKRNYMISLLLALSLSQPVDVDFNPDKENEMWITNRGFEGFTIVTDYGLPTEKVERRIDNHHSHFMSHVSSTSFAPGTGQFATCEGGSDSFMGPTLWRTNIFALVNQDNPFKLGSHIDMLHESPECMGIAWEKENVYWVADGRNGEIVRYDFAKDHGPGNDNHSDGIVRRYPDANFTRSKTTPSHMVIIYNRLFYADSGTGTIRALDISSGSFSKSLTGASEKIAEYSEYRGAKTEVFAEGLNAPSGISVWKENIFVSDYETGEILIYNINTKALLDRVSVDRGVSGITIHEGCLYYVNTLLNTVDKVCLI